MNKRNILVWLVIVCALGARLGMVAWAGNAEETSATGGSDTFAYQSLADSIAAHRGFSYAGMPTALRPPFYPLVLVLGRFVAGGYYRIFIRLFQLLIGILTAIICAKTSQKLGGSPLIALAAALAAPTLIFFSVEILSETIAALIVSLFFYVIVTNRSPIWAGLIIGLGMLERFNLAALAVAYLVYQFAAETPSVAARRTALAALMALAVVSPWFARNLVVFDGRVLYSTHTGTNLVQGLIMPDGRSQGDEFDRHRAVQGWAITDIETNSPHRNLFAAEPELDHAAKIAAAAELAHVNLFSLVARKLGYFWLGLDQMFRTQSLSRAKRFVRELGVLVYWFFLVAGIFGWRKLRLRNPGAARLFFSYSVVVTLIHLPFVMNTRIRAPLIEPVLAILAGLALTSSAKPSAIGPGPKTAQPS
jgi:dolichyl-phosphate-mannose-protein mannosyltransferase